MSATNRQALQLFLFLFPPPPPLPRPPPPLMVVWFNLYSVSIEGEGLSSPCPWSFACRMSILFVEAGRGISPWRDLCFFPLKWSELDVTGPESSDAESEVPARHVIWDVAAMEPDELTSFGRLRNRNSTQTIVRKQSISIRQSPKTRLLLLNLLQTRLSWSWLTGKADSRNTRKEEEEEEEDCLFGTFITEGFIRWVYQEFAINAPFPQKERKAIFLRVDNCKSLPYLEN